MGGKNKRQKKFSLQHNAHVIDDYSLTISLSKMKKYGNRDYGVTDSENEIEPGHSYSMSNSQAIQSHYTSDNINRTDYYNLDDKIMTLTDNNNQAHDNLRKELEKKIEDSAKESSNKISEVKSLIKWLIGIIVTIGLGIGGLLFVPYNIASKNKEEINNIKNDIKALSAISSDNSMTQNNIKQDSTTSCPSTK